MRASKATGWSLQATNLGNSGEADAASMQQHGTKRSVLDVQGTSHRPDGPWPADNHPLLTAWIKLECMERISKKHESSVSFLEDSVQHHCLTVVRPYSKGSTLVDVEGLDHVDMSDASENTPVVLLDPKHPETRVAVMGVIKDQLCTMPTDEGGRIGQTLVAVKADLVQAISEYHPMYRRNVLNFMPSMRFTPNQYLGFPEYGFLQRKLSGPVTKIDFVLFFLAKGYVTMGSSPWPVFTAMDGRTAYAYQLHVVIEQEAGKEDSFEARWKIICGEASAKTRGIDPTKFSIIVFQKTGRLVRLFVNGCEHGHAAAELVVEDEDDTIANISEGIFGMDANGSKFFDGEISEFLAYSAALADSQIDNIGKYLSRRFDVPWTWHPPQETHILDDWLEAKARGKVKKKEVLEIGEGEEVTESTTYKEDVIQVESAMRYFGSPEDAIPCLQLLTRLAKFPRKRMIIVKHNPFDQIFEFMDSSQTLLKVAAIRLLTMLCKNNKEALQEVAARDGLFLLLHACEPEWKQALEELLNEKQAMYDKAVKERDLVKEALDAVDKSNVSSVFQARMRLKYFDSMIEEAKLQVEGVYKRMTSGIEQMNNYELVRTAAGAIAMIVDQDDESKELLIKMSGLMVLDRVLDTPNIPVQTSICKVIFALVQGEKVATALVKEGMMGKIVRLMFLDDPPVQCEAAAIILKTIVHKKLRELLLEFDLIPALHRMLSGPYEDNYLGCTRVFHILSTHDDGMRVKIVENEGTINCLVNILKSPNLEVRQRAIQTLAYIALSDEGSAKMWEAGFMEVMHDLLDDSDRVVLTHTIMAVANGSRNEAICRRLYAVDIQKTMVALGQHSCISYQHLVCGVIANMATVRDKKLPHLHAPEVLSFLCNTLSQGTLHARYEAAKALRRMAWQAPYAKKIVAANVLPALIDLARKPQILIDEPAASGISKHGRSLYMHWQASRVIAALTCSPDVHLAIVRHGGLFALIQLCDSGLVFLQREGASSLAFIAEIRCETECILQMAEAGAIDALQSLTESEDDATGAEAMRALSSLLNFDSAWS